MSDSFFCAGKEGGRSPHRRTAPSRNGLIGKRSGLTASIAKENALDAHEAHKELISLMNTARRSVVLAQVCFTFPMSGKLAENSATLNAMLESIKSSIELFQGTVNTVMEGEDG